MFSNAAAEQRDWTFEEQALIPRQVKIESVSTVFDSDDHRQRYELHLGRDEVRLETSAGALPGWVHGIARGLNRVAGLPENWDSYGALPVSQRVLRRALDVALKVMEDRYPEPQVGATVKGGVSFEWHRSGRSLEIEIEGASSVHAYYFDEFDPSADWEAELDGDLAQLAPYMKRLVRS